jgi:hypothetical protein
MDKYFKPILAWGAVIFSLVLVRSCFKDGGAGDDVEIVEESTGPVSGWGAGDVVGFKAIYLNDKGADTGQFMYGAFRVRELSPILDRATHNVGVGGVSRVTIQPGDYPGAGRADDEFKYAEVEVLFRIPEAQVIDSFADEAIYPLETGVLVLDHSGLGGIDVLGGRPWQQKNSWYLDSVNCRPFSMDGGEVRLWEWLGPKSGFLVWKNTKATEGDNNPKKGEGSSGNKPKGNSEEGAEDIPLDGLDLVGVRTGGQEWESAYKPLEYVDEDKNGWIEGPELETLSYWIDKDSNGKASIGEINDASGIFQKISTKFIADQFGAKFNPQGGAVLTSGKQVGSWEFWPRGETVPSVKGWQAEAALIQSQRGEKQAGLDWLSPGAYASLFLFNACGAADLDVLPPDSGEVVASQVEKNNTVRIGLTPSKTKSGDEISQKTFGRWEWVGPCAGMLVKPSIVNASASSIGEHIYGSNIGGIDWSDSYQALSYLDADLNGWLQGRELDGIYVWVDRNRDGGAGENEIRPARDTISKVNVRPRKGTKSFLEVPKNGVIFRNGKESPSWCWISRGIE